MFDHAFHLIALFSIEMVSDLTRNAVQRSRGNGLHCPVGLVNVPAVNPK